MAEYDVWVDNNEVFETAEMPEPVATFNAASVDAAARIAAGDGAFDRWFCRSQVTEINLLIRRKGSKDFWQILLCPVTSFEIVTKMCLKPEDLEA